MIRPWLLVFVLLGSVLPAQAQYDFQLFDVPFQHSRATTITGRMHGETFGTYLDARSHTQSFWATCSGDILPLPNLTVRASSSAAVAGWFLARTGRTTGFVLQDGTFTTLEGRRADDRTEATLTEALDVNASGVVVGTFRRADGVFHGFRFTPTPELMETFDAPPPAVETALLRIANDGRILARAVTADGTTSYLLFDQGTWTPLTLPDLPGAHLVGRLPNGALIGNTATSGFVFHEGAVTLINPPGNLLTQLFGNDEDGILYGQTVGPDNVAHGFLAIPDGLPDPCEDGPRKGKDDRDKPERGHQRPR